MSGTLLHEEDQSKNRYKATQTAVFNLYQSRYHLLCLSIYSSTNFSARPAAPALS